jgi:hypothetical protein
VTVWRKAVIEVDCSVGTMVDSAVDLWAELKVGQMDDVKGEKRAVSTAASRAAWSAVEWVAVLAATSAIVMALKLAGNWAGCWELCLDGLSEGRRVEVWVALRAVLSGVG